MGTYAYEDPAVLAESARIMRRALARCGPGCELHPERHVEKTEPTRSAS